MTIVIGQGDVPPSVRLERRFYTLVRWFGLMVTVLAIVAIIASGFLAMRKLGGSVDKHLQEPTTSYADFRQTKEAAEVAATAANVDPTLQIKEREAAAAAAEVERLRRMQPFLDSIMTNLTLYATKVDTGKPSAPAVDDFIRKNMSAVAQGYGDPMAWEYVGNLQKAVIDLVADGDRLAKLGTNDQRRVRWDQFIEWHASAYRRQLDQQEQRIRQNEDRIAAEKASVVWNLYGAAAAFGIFVIATILLVLLRIEKNTRPVTVEMGSSLIP